MVSGDGDSVANSEVAYWCFILGKCRLIYSPVQMFGDEW